MNHTYISSGRVSSVVDDLLERIIDQLGAHGWTSMPRRYGAGTAASPPSCLHRRWPLRFGQETVACRWPIGGSQSP